MIESDSDRPGCPRCGARLASDAPEGLCVRCLGRLNFTADSVFTGPEPSRSEPPSPEEIAPHFPQLDILACLGRGGMGVVYKARQKALDRLVALKVLAPEREEDPQFAGRFAREAQALARLNHPHIVTVHDFGRADGLFYLLMEYVDGVNLRQLLRTQRLAPEEALAIVPPICDALQYAHDRAVVHRDIKPENLLLDRSGRIKIADFGIARMLGGDVAPCEERGVGTPRYMAPEQHTTPREADHRADIYSLGVVFYEMLTGELPAGPIEPPSRKIRIDVRLDEIVLRALEHEPGLRFQKAGQMKTAVETLTGAGSEAEPGISPPASGSNRPGLPGFRASRVGYAMASLAIALAALFLAGIAGSLYTSGGRLSDKPPDARNSSMFVEEARRGLDAFREREFDQAIASFDELIRLDPKHSEAHRWRGDASLNKGELDKALSEYDEAIRLDPKNGMAHCSRGAASTLKGDHDRAIASFDEAIRLDPKIANISFYRRFRSATEAIRPRPRASEFDEEARRGLDAFARGDYDRAAASFDELIRLDPKHSEAHRWRGDASLNKGELDRAMSEYGEAIRLDPKNGMAHCSRGAALTEEGKFDRAIDAFDEAVRLDPKIADMPFYRRYRRAAESPASRGLLMIVPWIVFGLMLLIAFAGWSTSRRGKPEAERDF